MSASANTDMMVVGSDVETSVQQTLTPLGLISAYLPNVLCELCDGYLKPSYYTRAKNGQTEEHQSLAEFLKFMYSLPPGDVLRVTEIFSWEDGQTTPRGYRTVSEWVAEYSN
jgi:hypothetical protein